MTGHSSSHTRPWDYSESERTEYLEAIGETAVLLDHLQVVLKRARVRCRPGVHEFYTEVMAKRVDELALISEWLRQRPLGTADSGAVTMPATFQRR